MKTYAVDYEAKQIDRFDERWYQITKPDESIIYLRSVTTILGIIDKGYQYDQWLKNVGHNAEIIVDRAGNLGTTVHALIERVLKHETVVYEESIGIYAWERFIVWCELWKEFCSKNKVDWDPDYVEFITHDLELEYAGQADLPLRVNDEWCLIDWKTGNNLQKAPLQLVAYMRSLEKQLDIKMTKGIIGWIPRTKPNKKGYRLIDVENSEELFQVFIAARNLYMHEHGKEKPKYVAYPTQIDLEFIEKNQIVKLNPENKNGTSN